MAAQKVEIFLPERDFGELERIVSQHCRRYWREGIPGQAEKLTCLVQRRYTERLLENVEQAYGAEPGFAIIVSPVEATIPPIVETTETELLRGSTARQPNAIERWFSRDRISTDELYDDIEDSLRLRPNYLLTVLLSALIAGLGMRSGQTAVVIGAMVIAPLLGPSMGLAMAATIGDRKLAWRAATTLSAGTVLALIAGFAVGLMVEIDPTVAELRNRSLVQPGDIALALACGMAGVLAFSRGTALSLIGVMIAVALVPPLAACGIFAATGDLGLARGALMLFVVNLVCINVAGIATFLFQGLPPKNWRMTTGIIAVWIVLLFGLTGLVAGGLVDWKWPF